MSSREPTEEEVMQLMKAAESGDVATLQHLIQDNKMDINTHGPSHHPWWKKTPLLVAATYGQYDVVTKLLDLGANIHAVDSLGETVLHCAAKGGNPSVVDHFINAGVDMNAVANNGVTVLHCAALGGNSSVVDRFIKAGLDLNAVTNNGVTVLHCAARGGNLSVVDCFIKAGLDVNAVDKDGVTVLHCATMGGNPSVVDRFIKAGLDVNAVDKRGRTVLHCAAIGGNLSVVDHFINAGLDLNAVTNYKLTPLHLASMNGHAGVVEILLRKGAAVNQTDKSKMTPLHWASRSGHAAVVEALLRKGAAVNQTDERGRTPLKLAVEYDKSAVVWTIIKSYKADISQYDEETKWKISKLLAVEEEKRKVQQDKLTSNLEMDIVTSSTENTAATKLLSPQLQEAASSEDTQQPITQQTLLSTAVTTENENLTLDQDSVNAKTAMDYIRKEYKSLIHLTISTDAIRDLYMEQVITHKEKKEMQGMKTEDRMEFLLDDVIIPSLEANSGLKYVKLIRVMKRSDDILIKAVASKLRLHLYS